MDTTRPSLLIRLRDRSDADAWRAFDAIYRPILYRFARHRGLDHADAEDVVQHCLASITDHIAEFSYDPTRGRFKAWLRTLVFNRARNLARGRRHAPVSAESIDSPDEAQAPPDEAFDQLWLQEHLWHALSMLRGEVDPATYRAFVAYVVEQRPAEELAAELGLSLGNLYTIKWRLTRRIAQLMHELTGDGNE